LIIDVCLALALRSSAETRCFSSSTGCSTPGSCDCAAEPAFWCWCRFPLLS